MINKLWDWFNAQGYKGSVSVCDPKALRLSTQPAFTCKANTPDDDAFIYEEIFENLDATLYSINKFWKNYGTWRVELWVNSYWFGEKVGGDFLSQRPDTALPRQDFADIEGDSTSARRGASFWYYVPQEQEVEGNDTFNSRRHTGHRRQDHRKTSHHFWLCQQNCRTFRRGTLKSDQSRPCDENLQAFSSRWRKSV